VKQLVVTADDFGAAVVVNAAVERAHAEGVLSAASLMVGGPAAADAVDRARRIPSLKVGLHLVLVEGSPLSDPVAVAGLVDAAGAFRTDMVRLGVDIFFRPAVRRQLAKEIEAQFQAFAATGLPLDHVNAHKHFHVHPTVAGLILRIGRRYGMTALRVPVEPRAVLRAIEPQGGRGGFDMVGPWAGRIRRRAARVGVRTPDQVFGLQWSGAMTRDRLAGVLRRLPEGLSEIYLHPALADSYPGSAPGYRYVEEFEGLIDPGVASALAGSGAALGGFGDLGR
jgi:hopanoid biosynthesis associated protein HpnK